MRSPGFQSGGPSRTSLSQVPSSASSLNTRTSLLPGAGRRAEPNEDRFRTDASCRNDRMQLPDAIERIRPSIVQIERLAAIGRPDTIGSGFLVGDPLHIVTAKHVVDAVNLEAGERVVIGFAVPDIDTPQLTMRASFVGTDASLIDTWEEHDLAPSSRARCRATSAGCPVGRSVRRRLTRRRASLEFEPSRRSGDRNLWLSAWGAVTRDHRGHPRHVARA
jgi:hypothetical protein